MAKQDPRQRAQSLRAIGSRRSRRSGSRALAVLAALAGCGRLDYAQHVDDSAIGEPRDGSVAVDASELDADVSGVDSGDGGSITRFDADVRADAGPCSAATCAWGCVGDRCSGPIEIEGGRTHACALLGTGEVACWGSNGYGQLGVRTSAMRSSLVPLVVPGLTDIVEISSAQESVCARHATGAVSCWGWGDAGQLGDGLATSHTDPAPVSGLSDAVAIGSARFTVCAVRTTGAVVCWGWLHSGEDGVCGASGGGSTAGRTPTEIVGITDAVAVTVGEAFHCVLRAGGTVACWGANACGQLGNGDTAFQSAPVPVSGLSGVVEVAAGDEHACARLASGEVRCWGANAAGQLGDGTTIARSVPTLATELTPAIALGSHGEALTCVLRASGNVTCRGANDFGQRGDGLAATPVDVSGLIGAIAVGNGWWTGYAIRATGDPVAWGSGGEGQLGSGGMIDSPTPVAIAPP
jgi:alpha-tubulin suppressor-like RCC1 family protein